MDFGPCSQFLTGMVGEKPPDQSSSSLLLVRMEDGGQALCREGCSLALPVSLNPVWLSSVDV